ncbi:putative NAD dependent epimerase/dehydratase [Polyplosphaeria fusca]|uniref:NAD dependent epimerase/dehydratase n=1 Tax=Polyplosphaeria fusca TaxID=682080 RepID=A0A9P4UX57_9PLEO|nr:putative NAD dependent epimerase/dehydratase [Polyplosphaeria fusca]
MSGKRIFMTGASGYIGSRVTTLALAQGHTVHGLVRSDASASKLKSLGATPIHGNVSTDHAVLTREAAAADVVIHLADTLTNDFNQPYEKVLETEYKVLDAFFAALKGTEKPLITTSGSLVAAEEPDNKETDETTPYRENVHIQRHLGEKYALEQGEKHGVRVCVIRLPGFVYGLGASGMGMFANVFSGAGEAVYVADNAEGELANVYVDDAARMYLLAIEKGRAGQAYNCTNATYVAHRDWVEAMGKTLGVPVRGVSAEEAREKAGFLSLFLVVKNRATSTKARRELGWETEGVGLIEDLTSGSYAELAKTLKSKK